MTESSSAPPWQAQIRQRLLDRAADASWTDLWPSVVARRLELIEAIAAISEEQAAWKPGADDWSVAETIRHQLVSSRGVIEIVEALASDRAPGDGVVYDSPGDLTAHEVAPDYAGSFAELRAEFLAHSVEFAALPSRLPAEPNRTRTFEHMYFGPLPASAWFAFQRIHDGAHLNQIEQIVAVGGFPARTNEDCPVARATGPSVHSSKGGRRGPPVATTPKGPTGRGCRRLRLRRGPRRPRRRSGQS